MVSKDFGTTLPWNYHPEAGARIGLLPKYAKDASQLRWFDLPGFFAFHTANAWQEGPLVHLFVAAFDNVRSLPTPGSALGCLLTWIIRPRRCICACWLVCFCSHQPMLHGLDLFTAPSDERTAVSCKLCHAAASTSPHIGCPACAEPTCD